MLGISALARIRGETMHLHHTTASRITTPFIVSLCLLGVIALPGVASGQGCVFPNRDFDGITIVSDRPDGVSSDGRGPYRKGEGGVWDSRAGSEGAFGIDPTAKDARSITVNLSKPVPGGGGVPLGLITSPGGLITQRVMVGDTVENLADIAVGQTVPTALMSASFFVNGRFHLLQMGPLANGHCGGLGARNLVHGTGTSSGTIFRASQTKWVIDLLAGSQGRLFDMQGPLPAGQWPPSDARWEHAVDKGLYYVGLHYEVIDAVPYVKNVLLPVAEAEGGPAVVARYRALRRDSSTAYVFDVRQLNQIGYWLLEHKKANDAVIVFRLNVEEYPEAANPYVGLGEAYLATGDTARAIANLKRSLELNPKNQYAANVLRSLGAKP